MPPQEGFQPTEEESPPRTGNRAATDAFRKVSTPRGRGEHLSSDPYKYPRIHPLNTRAKFSHTSHANQPLGPGGKEGRTLREAFDAAGQERHPAYAPRACRGRNAHDPA